MFSLIFFFFCFVLGFFLVKFLCMYSVLFLMKFLCMYNLLVAIMVMGSAISSDGYFFIFLGVNLYDTCMSNLISGKK